MDDLRKPGGSLAMVEDTKDITVHILALQLKHLEALFDLHRAYQKDQTFTAQEHLESKLVEMNRFREENLKLTQKFATTETMEALRERDHFTLESFKKELIGRLDQLGEQISKVEHEITPHLGPRVMTLELAKSNLEGRIWALAAIMIIIEVALQIWPLVRHSSP